MPTDKNKNDRTQGSSGANATASAYQPKHKIAIIGAAETGHCQKDALKSAEELGQKVAEAGMVLITGVTTGVPYWAAKGAKNAGGTVIGFSPAGTKEEHVDMYQLPTDYHDVIVYTGSDYAGRNLLLSRAADALVTVCGRMGTLNTFTIAFEDEKPIGVLEGSGGTADMVANIVENAHRGPGKVVFEKDAQTLFEKVVEMIQK